VRCRALVLVVHRDWGRSLCWLVVLEIFEVGLVEPELGGGNLIIDYRGIFSLQSGLVAFHA
jgi:hypothetical protein